MTSLHSGIHRIHRPDNLDIPNPGSEMDIEDEQNVEDSLPSTPLEGFSSHSRTREYAATSGSTAGESEMNTQLDGERVHPDISQQEDEDIPTMESKSDSSKKDEENDRTCRICFSGPEEEISLGRMISPCLCSGSMRYVHVKCLNAWRGTGTNAKAHLECPQCHYRYQLRRTLISGLATSRPILLLSTLLSFITLTLILGETLHLLLNHSPTISRTLLSKTRTPVQSMFDVLDDPYGAIDGGPVIVVGGGGALVWDIFIMAIQTFVDLSESFSAYKDQISINLPGGLMNFSFEIIIRFLLGLAMLGSMSFLSLLLSLSLFGPLQLVNGLRGFGFLGNWSRRRFGRTIDGNTSSSIGTIMIIILVLIGAINTLIGFYNLVGKLNSKLLLYVETQILEVNSEEILKQRKESQRKERQQRDREKWYIRWIKDGQYKRIEGWKEVFVRLSLGIDRWIEGVKRGFRQGGDNEDHEE